MSAKCIIIFVNMGIKLGQDDPEWILVLMANVSGICVEGSCVEIIYCIKAVMKTSLGNKDRG